jgi:hypothetical protein
VRRRAPELQFESRIHRRRARQPRTSFNEKEAIMASLFSGKMSGRTAATVDGTATGIIATVTVSLDSDDMLRWTDANGDAHAVKVHGEVAALLTALFTGAGGITQKLFV